MPRVRKRLRSERKSWVAGAKDVRSRQGPVYWLAIVSRGLRLPRRLGQIYAISID